jgi:hypothetical protein
MVLFDFEKKNKHSKRVSFLAFIELVILIDEIKNYKKKTPRLLVFIFFFLIKLDSLKQRKQKFFQKKYYLYKNLIIFFFLNIETKMKKIILAI